MLRSAKSHSLNFEFPADKREKIDTGDDQIAAQSTGRFILDPKVSAEFFENLGREKCNLPFVIFAKIEVAIAAQAAAGDAFHFRHFHERKVAWGSAVMTDEIVTRRNENLPDHHRIENES